ncbi:MAG: hypothetical protein HY690_04590 [Chloroflexi bacterium]|nr:hypothetical protein [Chloroflexota bacterium]
MRTPTWQEIEQFLRVDGWESVRSTGHSHYRKVLADGSVLRTHVSLAGDRTMSPERFALILRAQLEVGYDDFWNVLRTGRPAPRPGAAVPEAPKAIPAWVVNALKHQLGKSDEEIAAMTPQEAERYIRERWSQPRP